MPQVGFEPLIPVFERAKIVHALDRTATATGLYLYLVLSNDQNSIKICLTNRVTYSAYCNPLRYSLDDGIPYFVFLKLDCEIYNIEKENKRGKRIRTAIHFANIHGHVY
jgi:hypothetical protein